MASGAVTLNDMETLSMEERFGTGFTHKVTIDYTDINDSTLTGTTDDITATIGNTPTKFAVLRALVICNTAFANTGVLNIEVGTDGDPDNFITATDLIAGGTGAYGAAGGIPATFAGSAGVASDVLAVKFSNTTSGSPSAVNAGSLDLFLELASL